MAPRKNLFNDDPRKIAAALIESPNDWRVIAESPKETSRTLRSAAHRLKSRRFVAFEKQVQDLAGFWEVTVRINPEDPDMVRMHARWIPA